MALVDVEYRVKETEPWAKTNEQRWHDEAIQTYGERVIIRRVWTLVDFENGLTTRCATCQVGASTAVQIRMAELYKDSADSTCLDCFGTGYTGGFEPVIHVTWALVDDGSEGYTGPGPSPGGMVRDRDKPNVQFSWEPVLEPGDLVVRVQAWNLDGITPLTEEGRFQITGPVAQQTVRTGPQALDTDIIVGQTGAITRLPEDHVFYEVPLA